MSGMAYGLGAFIEGYVRGETMRRDRKRQDKYDAQADEDRLRRHKIEDAREGRASEEFGWRRSDRARAEEDRRFYEDLYRTSVETADNARPAPEQGTDVRVSSAGTPLTFGPLGAIPGATQPGAMPPMQGPNAPAIAAPAAAPTSGGQAIIVPVGDETGPVRLDAGPGPGGRGIEPTWRLRVESGERMLPPGPDPWQARGRAAAFSARPLPLPLLPLPLPERRRSEPAGPYVARMESMGSTVDARRAGT